MWNIPGLCEIQYIRRCFISLPFVFARRIAAYRFEGREGEYMMTEFRIFGWIMSWKHVISCLIICGFWNKRVYIIILMTYLYAIGARVEMLRNISSWNCSLLLDIVFIWTLSFEQIMMMCFVFFNARYILAINAFCFKRHVVCDDLWWCVLYSQIWSVTVSQN